MTSATGRPEEAPRRDLVAALLLRAIEAARASLDAGDPVTADQWETIRLADEALHGGPPR